MSNRSERNRLKRKGHIQKLLGEDFLVESNYGGFMAYKRGSAVTDPDGRGIRVRFQPHGTRWIITSELLGLNWTGDKLREGVKHVHAGCLLVV